MSSDPFAFASGGGGGLVHVAPDDPAVRELVGRVADSKLAAVSERFFPDENVF